MPIFAVCLKMCAPSLRYFQNYLNIKNLNALNTIPLVSSLWLTSPRHPLPKDSFSLSLFLGISERGWGWDCCLHSDWTVVVKFHRVSAIGSGWKKKRWEVEFFCMDNCFCKLFQQMNKRCLTLNLSFFCNCNGFLIMWNLSSFSWLNSSTKYFIWKVIMGQKTNLLRPLLFYVISRLELFYGYSNFL